MSNDNNPHHPDSANTTLDTSLFHGLQTTLSQGKVLNPQTKNTSMVINGQRFASWQQVPPQLQQLWHIQQQLQQQLHTTPDHADELTSVDITDNPVLEPLLNDELPLGNTPPQQQRLAPHSPANTAVDTTTNTKPNRRTYWLMLATGAALLSVIGFWLSR